jgi:hypothetical protein
MSSDYATEFERKINKFFKDLESIVNDKINDKTNCSNFKELLDSVKKDMVDYINNSNLKKDDNYDNLSDEEKLYLKNYIKSRKDELTNIIQLKQFNCSLETYTPPLSPDVGRKYDQVVKGDVSILRINKNSYKITFDKIGKFLLYQVWDEKGVDTYTYTPNNPSNDDPPRNYSSAVKYAYENPDKVKTVDVNINNYRYIIIKNEKKWVEYFNTLNSRINFTPTTVMQISNKKYVFVIKKAKINKKGELVFYVATKEINIINDCKSDKVTKIFKKLPIGKYHNVRFDIDDSQYTSCASCECWCPNNAYVYTNTSTFGLWCQQNICTTNYTSVADICYYCPPGFIENGGNSATREMWGLSCCFVDSSYGLPLSCVVVPKEEPKLYNWNNSGSYGGAQCCTNTSNVTTCSEASQYTNPSEPTCTTTGSYCNPVS